MSAEVPATSGPPPKEPEAMKLSALLPVLACGLLSPLGAQEKHPRVEDDGANGRAVLEKYGAAVVGIEIEATVRITIDGSDVPPGHVHENAQGTVVADTGLTVTSFGSIDIGTIVRSRHVVMGPGAAQLRVVNASYESITLHLADGSDCPGRLVSTDPSLDLAFLLPMDPLARRRLFTYVDLARATVPLVLKNYLSLSLGPKDLGWPQEAHPTTIVGITAIPRRLIIVNYETRGCPILDWDGSSLGISVRAKSSTANGISVVIPSADILSAEPK
jgi:hypothetical protein